MYAVLNKQTKTYFAGFNPDHSVAWVDDIQNAKGMEKFSARNQASLLICNDHPVQNKPVRIPLQ